MNFNSNYEELFYQSLRIRMIEEKIAEIYPTDKIQSPVHLSIGQEAVAVGVCHHLKKTDLIYSSYRSHAYFLAKGGDLKAMLAELFGKYDGSGKGKAGSMHLADKSIGMMGSSAIVASTISHGVGSAFASKLLKKEQVVVTTFGDGATEEGSYHESLNLASVFSLPVIFICENNGLAIHSNESQRHAYTIHQHAASYNIKTTYIKEGYDFELIADAMYNIIQDVRENKRPHFVEIKTYRYREHVGIADDHNVPYRSQNEYETWKKMDPLILDQKMVTAFKSEISREIDAAVEFAELSPYPPASELLNDVY
ncbi:MAG TPA: thiamine pyrophosphate-dependent dehydrogenase E1 component subunit alpha [Puia sp.]|jgi:TPP-dependent pyruvate/acetoin dehydrogenase alpha subunit|nr:thiamine pyrophosphate-dependent dehydrogenase E1 component subunit alpha [Puia sp.]